MTIRKKIAESKIESAEQEAKRVVDLAKVEAENMKKEEIFKAKEEIMNSRKELDQEIKERRSEVQKQESRMIQKEENLDRRSENLEKKERDLDKEYQSLENQKEEVNKVYEKQVEERKKLEDFVARNKARVATRGMANSRQKILDKMEILERPKEKLKPTFNFRNARAAARIIFETKDLVLGYNEPLTKPLNFQLERGQKIALKGMNGIGKSTLLRTLLGMTKPFDGQVASTI